MEFQEIDMSPTTTPSTCYSGARNDECDTIRLATETNLLGIHIDVQNGIKRVASESIRSNFICVGHSQWGDDHHASIYLNASRLPAESDEPTLSRPLDRDDTDASVVSNSVPTANVSVVSTKSLGTEPSSKSNSSSLNNESKSKEKESSPESEKMDCRLVLTTREAEFTAILTGFRPLCPCLACWGEISIGVWLGSADDPQLRLYMPNRNTGTLDSVLSLPSEVLNFNTPVLAIDFASLKSLEVLAVACQDGTIQLITWKGDGFEALGHYQVIVDGPILALRIQEVHGTVNVFVGSLCGYVCLLSRTEQHPPNQWDGPKMVVEGLQNRAIESADSVVTLNVHENLVAIGTHSGCCTIYAKVKRRYYKVWECQLPYSVHGILFQQHDEEKLLLLVTTRRSIHLFAKTKGIELTKGGSAQSEKKNPSATNIQNRLQALLRPKQPPPEISVEVEESNTVDLGEPHHETNEPKDNEEAEESSQIKTQTLEEQLQIVKTKESKNEADKTSRQKETSSVDEQHIEQVQKEESKNKTEEETPPMEPRSVEEQEHLLKAAEN